MKQLPATVILLLSCICSVYAANDTDDASYAYDPILAHRPSFSQSMAVQILLTGIVFTLTAVLLVHLIFTAQYHWPLAQGNYVLQLSAVITLLVSLIATLTVIMDAATDESRQWPYMFNYISVDIPPLDDENRSSWTTSELAAWLLMNATTSGLIHITHIQFLTLLFPSTLERRLIFVLLAPLAIVSAITQLIPIADNDKLVTVASAVQNVCNATLSVLFTTSLLIWGFLVNRKQAWRTDGGTAAFGVGALILALISTAITFMYIPKRDQFDWMPPLIWAVILWQSFLGWWWWVGAGMGVGEVEELLRREEKRRRKRKLQIAKRKARRERAQTVWRGVTEAFGRGRECGPRASASGSDSAEGSPSRMPPSSVVSAGGTAGSRGPLSGLLDHRPVHWLYGWYLYVRHAHLTAAREQAAERVEKINQVYGPDGRTDDGDPAVVGWGLGSYALRSGLRREEEVNKDLELDMRSISDEGKILDEDSGEEMETGVGSGVDMARMNRARRGRPGSMNGIQEQRTERDEQSQAPASRPASMWWWGPLRRWRLQDTTIY